MIGAFGNLIIAVNRFGFCMGICQPAPAVGTRRQGSNQRRRQRFSRVLYRAGPGWPVIKRARQSTGSIASAACTAVPQHGGQGNWSAQTTTVAWGTCRSQAGRIGPDPRGFAASPSRGGKGGRSLPCKGQVEQIERPIRVKNTKS